jgi:hypothetical protein
LSRPTNCTRNSFEGAILAVWTSSGCNL